MITGKKGQSLWLLICQREVLVKNNANVGNVASLFTIGQY